MRLQAARPSDLLVDTDEILDAAKAAALRATGIKGVFRYLGDVSAAEAATILGAGLVLFFVNHSRAYGWIPSAAEGAADGARDVQRLQKLGVPKGVHAFFDLEGVGGGDPRAVIAHVNAWAAAVKAAGYIAGLYVGEQTLLTSDQLFALPDVHLYWHSASRVTDASGKEAGPACGWAIFQGNPVDVVVAGVVVDYDSVYEDHFGRLPIGVAA
ncbi:MAG TPA: glycoside hydrolase domain-containing protein [Polyangiaceae bacterium]|nr:glycoside hydrolase domain-containing protein [Polyangiaceae bacterium]